MPADGSLPTSSGARRYTILRRLAVGGMGELLLARAEAPGGVQKLVAIKRVRPEYATDAEFVKMFLNEARLAATLDHPNVVRTYDLVEEEGNFLMVMEYLHGESLGTLLNKVVSAGRRVPLAHIVTIVLGVAAGLHCAHERRGVDGRPLDIVHRDLSPGNIFVTYEGGVKLLDFGIAKATSRTSITIGPSRKGKVSYMSPEQCVGEQVDRRSDIFALGVVMWELSTGRRLFKGDNEFAVMNQVTSKDAPSPRAAAPDLPTPLVEIIEKALQRDPAKRFQTAIELHDELEAFARADGLLPSAIELSRWVEQTCGRREMPSVEPTEEFASLGGATVVIAGEEERVPWWRRYSVPLALLGGISLGAVAVAMASSGSEPEAVPAAAEKAEPPQQPTEAPTPEVPSTDEQPVEVASETPEPATPEPETAEPETPEPETAEPETETEAEVAKATPKKKSRRRPPRKKSSPKEPSSGKPQRGVDGILPSG